MLVSSLKVPASLLTSLDQKMTLDPHSIRDFRIEDGDKQRVLDCLRNTPLVPSADGTLQTASCFYDPGIDVFRTMLPDINFPSEPFDSHQWITFLRKIGLVDKVSVAHFKRFAKEVADEAATARTQDTHEKSKVLVHHLFSRHDVISEGLLHDARDISFVLLILLGNICKHCVHHFQLKQLRLKFLHFIQWSSSTDHRKSFDQSALASKVGRSKAMHPGLRSSDTNLTTIPVTLHKSAELIFDDAPAYGERIQGLNQLFVLDLSLIDVRCKSAMTNYKELIMKLPAPLQPKMLSNVVKEKLTNAETVTSAALNALMQRLSSALFVCGIVRIIRHVNSQKKGFDEGVITNIERGLQSIRLYAVDSLKTTLYYNDDFIPGSEAKVRSFQENVGSLARRHAWFMSM
ncbi:hypothetical protein OS493_010888 [Desmophyllum pertusum]|uniref:Uncharacterized protein n=1 Tax=Desmophyllum pertusum TaxID=174260 RepID=A0A9W9ZEH2_9CNID|nr:hypothetical protein OS493_010888 [Desmophyllum pertusum]